MQTFSLCVFLSAAVAVVTGFAPLSSSRTVRSNRLFSTANASPPTMARSATKSPLDNLPWNKRRVEQREARRIRREAAKLYRELGIAEDSTYEEIVQQTDKLKAQAKDFKEQVRIDLGKDKILEMRLSERIAGLAKVSDEVRSQDTYDSEGVDDELMRELEDDVDLKPSWLEGIVVKPDNVWRNRQLKIWGILTALGVCFPPAIETFVILQYFVLTAQLLYRGQIMDPGNMWMMSSGEKAKGSHRKYTPFLAAGIMLAAKLTVFALMPPFARSRRWTSTVGWVGENALYMTSNLFLQPYRGD